MTTNTLLRKVGLLVAVGLLLSIAVAVIVWLEFKSPRTYDGTYPTITGPITIRTPALFPFGQSNVLSESEPTDVQTSPRAPASTSAATVTSLVPLPQPQIISDYLSARFIDGTNPVIRVCSNLQGTRSGPFTDSKSFSQTLEGVAASGSAENPYIESAIAPLAYAMSLPEVTRLVQQASEASAVGDTDAAQSDEFKSQLSLATSVLIGNQAELDRVTQHAYHLFVLTWAVNLAPNLVTDPETLSLCARLENAMRPGTEGDLDSEKTDLLRFLAYAGISPQQVGYDPSMRQDVRVVTSDQGLALRIPWLERLFSGRLGRPQSSPAPQ